MSELKTYALSDLDNWTFKGTALAVLGHPIKHSVSPQMHNAALADMAKRDPRFATWKYFRFDIAPEDLPVALEKFHKLRFQGLNLTVPHKVIAYNLPDLVVTFVRETPAEIGAVNTLTYSNNCWAGENTDGYGLETALNELNLPLADRDVIILGAGGAARGAAMQCLVRRCRSLWIANRTAENRESLRKELIWKFRDLSVQVHALEPGNIPHDFPTGSLVINATSAGLKPSDPLPIDLTALPRPCAVFDMIYNPPETRLLAQARALGIPAANGLSMLVHQGARALEIWSGAAVPVDAMRTAVHSAMKATA
jgi:shikimate dehydrogenase